jgi:DNA-binding transcriptional LysR family regulator
MVFKQGSITGASRLLNISQPALTRSIQTLENEVGSKLFERTPGGIAPTPFAERLYRRALSIINEVDAIRGDLLDLSSQYRRLLNVGSGLTCWCSVIDAIVDFQASAPDVALNVHVSNARDLISSSQMHGLDIIIGKQTTLETAEWLEVVPYRKLGLFFVVRSGHPVFKLPVERQIASMGSYPYATYHLLEDSHGLPGTTTPALRANHHLMLFRALGKTDYYLIVSTDMLEYARCCKLHVVGDASIGTDEMAIAYDPRNLSSTADDFKRFLLKG